MTEAWSGHLQQQFKKHARINTQLCTCDGEDVGVPCITQLGVSGFILPVVFEPAPNLDLVQADSLPVRLPTHLIPEGKV